MRAPARRPTPLRLQLLGPTLAEQLAGVRREVAGWATALGLGEELAEDLVLATHEALANVVDHAYSSGEPRAWVDLDRTDRDVEIVVRDAGSWRQPPADPGWRGRGMVIIHGLADRVEVCREATGTTVRMVFRIRPA